ncbi:hypothetical protein BHE74_00052065 [Ensete ventricosum]|nr:hypothetical protein BHE74_00052065 [Ensete ventricosum]
MSPERPFGDSGTEHRTEPDHPRQTEEATAAVPTPNHFWRMMTDPGFPSPASNPALLTVTTEAFLGLTSQVQALAGMVQTIISYLPQLMHSMAHQPAPRRHPRKRSHRWPQTGGSRPTLRRHRLESPKSAQLRRPRRQPDPKKEVFRSREEIGKSSKGGSPFTPEIQSKPLPATFRLPALEPYDGSGDPTEHIATFRAQMALYDTSEALILTTRDGPGERRAPLPVCRKVHVTSPGNPGPPSIPSHPSIPDGAEAVKVLLVAD